MKYRNFGNGEQLSAIGLGCMSMSHAYGVPDDKESVATLHYALDLGINFWDTADMYGNGKNEELISRVLSDNRDKIFIATKFEFKRNTKYTRATQKLCFCRQLLIFTTSFFLKYFMHKKSRFI